MSGNSISVDFQLWNNRWGESDIDDFSDFQIRARFRDKEDTILLYQLGLTYNDQTLSITVDDDARSATLGFPSGITLSGKANNGSSTDVENADNFLAFTLTYSVIEGDSIKEGDLKNLYLEIITD